MKNPILDKAFVERNPDRQKRDNQKAYNKGWSDIWGSLFDEVIDRTLSALYSEAQLKEIYSKGSQPDDLGGGLRELIAKGPVPEDTGDSKVRPGNPHPNWRKLK